jgi:hypothetical protein
MYRRFYLKTTLQKSSAPHFLANPEKIRLRIFSADEIFLGPLLRFAAEISTGWQHCSELDYTGNHKMSEKELIWYGILTDYKVKVRFP